MFVLAPTFTYLAARRDQVITLLHSLNAVTVKVADLPTSPAMGYVAAWANDDGAASALIYLHHVGTTRAVTYLYEPRTFSVAQLPGVVEEATEFLESMGFMLDDPGFGTLDARTQETTIDRTPLFHADLDRFAEAEELPEIEVLEAADGEVEPSPPQPSARARAIGRVLMSF